MRCMRWIECAVPAVHGVHEMHDGDNLVMRFYLNEFFAVGFVVAMVPVPVLAFGGAIWTTAAQAHLNKKKISEGEIKFPCLSSLLFLFFPCFFLSPLSLPLIWLLLTLNSFGLLS